MRSIELVTIDGLRQALDVVRDVVGSRAVPHAVGSTAAAVTTRAFVIFAVLAGLCIVLAGRSGRARVVGLAAAGLVATVVAGALGLLLKGAVTEPRPCQVDVARARWTACPPADSWSFPSNHAVFAGGFAVLLVVLAHLVGRRWIGAVGVGVAIVIAGSRVVLGVHYWWDVLAGLVFGGVAVALSLQLARRMSTSRGHTST